MGYCPFSLCVESRYSRLYRDIGRAAGAHGQAGHDHDTAEHTCDTASRRPRTRSACSRGVRRRGACGSARAHGLSRGKSRYNGLYRGLGQPLCLNRGSDTGCDTALKALRYGAHRPATRCKGAATRAAGARVAIQFLYHDRKGQRHGSVRVRAYNDMTTTRQGMACDTKLYAP